MQNYEKINNEEDSREEVSEQEKSAELRLSKKAQEQGESLLTHVESLKEGKESDFETRQETIEEYKRRVEKLKNDIEGSKKSFIRSIIDFRKIASVRRELERTENILSQRQDEQERRRELIILYEGIVAGQNKIESLMDEAYLENAKFDEKRKAELIEGEKDRDVKTLIEKHKVYFVHDIVDSDWKPSENNKAIDTRELDFEDHLNIVLGLDPTLSVSTISPDSKNRTFGKKSWGIIMSGGRVVGGEENDAATVAMGLRDRHIDERFTSIDAIGDAIERPLAGGKENSVSYNELVLENPEVAGVYFKWTDDFPEVREDVDISLKNNEVAGYGSWDGWWDNCQKSIETGAPLFMMESDNNIRMVYDINISNRTFKVTPVYTPETLIDMPEIYLQHNEESDKNKAVSRVIDKVEHLLTGEKREKYEQGESGNNSLSQFYRVY